MSDSGIVIDVLMIKNNNTIKIECGYPSSSFFVGTNPRGCAEVLNYFQKIGKLVE